MSGRTARFPSPPPAWRCSCSTRPCVRPPRFHASCSWPSTAMLAWPGRAWWPPWSRSGWRGWSGTAPAWRVWWPPCCWARPWSGSPPRAPCTGCAHRGPPHDRRPQPQPATRHAARRRHRRRRHRGPVAGRAAGAPGPARAGAGNRRWRFRVAGTGAQRRHRDRAGPHRHCRGPWARPGGHLQPLGWPAHRLRAVRLRSPRGRVRRALAHQLPGPAALVRGRGQGTASGRCARRTHAPSAQTLRRALPRHPRLHPVPHALAQGARHGAVLPRAPAERAQAHCLAARARHGAGPVARWRAHRVGACGAARWHNDRPPRPACRAGQRHHRNRPPAARQRGRTAPGPLGPMYSALI
eukprot:Opistho-1_new@54620